MTGTVECKAQLSTDNKRSLSNTPKLAHQTYQRPASVSWEARRSNNDCQEKLHGIKPWAAQRNSNDFQEDSQQTKDGLTRQRAASEHGIKRLQAHKNSSDCQEGMQRFHPRASSESWGAPKDSDTYQEEPQQMKPWEVRRNSNLLHEELQRIKDALQHQKAKFKWLETDLQFERTRRKELEAGLNQIPRTDEQSKPEQANSLERDSDNDQQRVRELETEKQRVEQELVRIKEERKKTQQVLEVERSRSQKLEMDLQSEQHRVRELESEKERGKQELAGVKEDWKTTLEILDRESTRLRKLQMDLQSEQKRVRENEVGKQGGEQSNSDEVKILEEELLRVKGGWQKNPRDAG